MNLLLGKITLYQTYLYWSIKCLQAFRFLAAYGYFKGQKHFRISLEIWRPSLEVWH